MADFCAQCTKTVLGVEPEKNDFVGICQKDDIVPVLCEGCGKTKVNSEGTCLGVNCIRAHNPGTSNERGRRLDDLPEHVDQSHARGQQ